MDDKDDLPEFSESDIINFTNQFLQKCNIEFTVEDVSECSSDLFLSLYHAMLGDFPTGALVDCKSKEAQVHNVNCVIDSLSMDYLNVDLSHISASDVVDGDLMAVYNLLEIMDGLLDYLLEKIVPDGDSGDEGDVDSDQLSDIARTMVMQTIRDEIGKQVIGNSSSSTAELIALGNSSIPDTEEFVCLEPDDTLTPDISDLPDRDQLSDHTLHTTVKKLLPTEKVDSDFSSASSESFKSLPTSSRDVSNISQTLAALNILGNYQEQMQAAEPKPKHLDTRKDHFSPPASSTVSESSCIDSIERKQALDVVLDDTRAAFLLRDKRNTQSESSATESVDVVDGGRDFDDSGNRIEGMESFSTGPKEKQKDWHAMLDSLQKTVEESKKIRERYFSASIVKSDGADSIVTDSLEEHGTLTTEGTANDSFHTTPRTPKKNVRFKDSVSTNTAKQLKEFREVLKRERELQDTKNRILRKNYQVHIDEIEDVEHRKLDPIKGRVKNAEKQVKEVLQQQKKRAQRSRFGAKKGLSDAPKWKSWQTKPKLSPKKKIIPKSLVAPGIESIGEHDLLPKLLEEFPQLELSPATLNDMWHKQFRQIEQLTSSETDHKNKKRRSELQLQEAHFRHDLLSKLLQKQHDHTRRLRDIKERSEGQSDATRTLRDRRLQTARIRRYYRDYHMQMRARMQKRRTKEERIFKRLFEDGLAIQKARLRELRRYARDKREEQHQRQRNEIQSLENYYKDQFNMLAETMAKERSDLTIRDKAQSKLVTQMKRGLRQKMEKEISDLQEMITRDDDDAYFREVEADRIRRQLQLSTFHAKIYG